MLNTHVHLLITDRRINSLCFCSTSVEFQANGMNKKYYSVLLSCLVTSGSYCHSINFKSGKEENLEDTPVANHFLENYDEDGKQSWTFFLALTAAVLTQLHYMKKSMEPDVENTEGDI